MQLNNRPYPLRGRDTAGAELGLWGGLADNRPYPFPERPFCLFAVLTGRGWGTGRCTAGSESSESVEGGLDGFKGGLWFRATASASALAKSALPSVSLRRWLRLPLPEPQFPCDSG